MTDNKSLAQEPASGTRRFESDSQKIVRQHLEDKDHVISEEDMRNVRVGLTPTESEERHLDDIVDEIEEEAKTNPKDENDEKPADNPITPWDTIEH